MIMGFKSLTARTILVFAALDVLFNPLVIVAFIPLLGMGGKPAPPLVLSVMVLLKILACAAFIRRQFRQYEVFAITDTSLRTKELVLRADEQLQASVTRIGVFYAFSWSLTYGLGYLILRSRFGDGLYFNSGALEVVALVMIAVWFGGLSFGMPLVAVLTSTAAGECSTYALQLGFPIPRTPESLQIRIGVIALALGLGPTIWTMALGYTKQVDSQEQQNRIQAELVLARVVDQFNPKATPDELRQMLQAIQGKKPGVELTLLGRRGESLLPDSQGETFTPIYGTHVVEQAKIAPSGLFWRPGSPDRVAYQRLENDTVAAARVEVPSTTVGGFVISASLFAMLVAVWAPVCAFILGRAVTSPVERLIRTTAAIVEEGKQSEIASLPVARNDEVGRLSARFNDLLEVMRDLSRAADSIATGKLRVEVVRKGELPDAFRRMLDSLRGIVREIRGTSVDLASAATEILAASQEQESAAASQSSAMEEINRTMESLAASAAHVSDSVQGVVANAEQTLTTTDRMVARITELSTHANRIGEILDVIREIADRSDLLALTGSLEASRAGESGHGFALVATEMRRLAERVTASVEDVKKLVSDIRDSGSSTVAATEESRRLADGTTEAARQITFVTQQQRSGTEQVSESIRNITDVVTQAVSATAQTRTSAQGLKTQADRLAALVKRFELDSDHGSSVA
jgi:methyl-accepting chemotaxis protein